jgi:hypothetical protein
MSILKWNNNNNNNPCSDTNFRVMQLSTVCTKEISTEKEAPTYFTGYGRYPEYIVRVENMTPINTK